MNRRPLAHWLKLAGLGVLVALGPVAARAQSPAPSPAPPIDAALQVPTVKLLAIGSFTAGRDQWKPLLPAEVRDTVRLYLAGKIDQWYVKQDQTGVVFMMNMTDPNDARALLGTLPFGQAGVMTFQIIPLGPISPLRTLLAEPAK